MSRAPRWMARHALGMALPPAFRRDPRPVTCPATSLTRPAHGSRRPAARPPPVARRRARAALAPATPPFLVGRPRPAGGGARPVTEPPVRRLRRRRCRAGQRVGASACWRRRAPPYICCWRRSPGRIRAARRVRARAPRIRCPPPPVLSFAWELPVVAGTAGPCVPTLLLINGLCKLVHPRGHPLPLAQPPLAGVPALTPAFPSPCVVVPPATPSHPAPPPPLSPCRSLP